jgi:hypothetical protein
MALTREAGTPPFGMDQKAVYGAIRHIEVGQEDMPGVDIALQPLRELPGVVSFAEGCQAKPLRIRTSGFSSLGGLQVEAVSGADGRFALAGLTTGKVTVSISDVSSPGLIVPVTSVKLGDRDVMRDGFESPYSGDDPLVVSVGCSNTGRAR